MKSYSIKDLQHRVSFCSMQDVVQDNASMVLVRVPVMQTWCCIRPKKASQFSTDGHAINETRDTKTYEITIRARPEISLSSAAWIYEERGRSVPRWFKLLKLKEEDVNWITFDCRLVERSDFVSKPTELSSTAPLPSGVQL
jgi:hypothetical protein